MATRRVTRALIGILVSLAVQVAAHAQSLPLSGSDWFIHDVDSPLDVAPALADIKSGDWIPSRVPGNIQADLEAAHRIGPLWYGAGDPRLPDVAKKNWWYRKDFVLPKTYDRRRLQLIFDGVDFGYEVWFNGKSLGTRAGQFRRSEFDVSDLAKPGEINRLAVRIDPIPSQLERCWSVDLPLSGALTPDWFVNCYAYSRQTLRDLKSVTNLSYDWGVNIYTLGIWRDVRIEASGAARIQWLAVQSKLTEDHRHASVKVHLEVASRDARAVRAIFRIKGPGLDKRVVTKLQLHAQRNDIDAVLDIDQPALWWPNGQGAQPLYIVDAALTDAAGKEFDTKRARFGVREVRWQQVEGVPANFINPYQLTVNGRPIRMLGSSLIPPDLLFGRIGLRAANLLYRAKAAGMNTLRLWGGGVPMPPEFYDLADELGIMLSQEFPLANSLPETDPIFLSNLSFSITDIVKQLRNHPSIIEWVGGNEMPWNSSTDHPALRTLEAVCAANDDRIFRATDPIDGSRHSPWYFIPQISYQHFNHIWELATDPTGPYTMNVMRYGEFGSQTPANLEVFQREIPPASQWPLSDINDPVLSRKNILQAAFNPLDWLYKPVIEGYFGPFDGPEELLKAGQYIGAESLRYFVDELRRKGKKIGGMTTWDFNEPWPNGAGSYLVDYDGQPLMNYYFVQQALAPVSLTLRYESNLYDPTQGLDTELWLASDSPDPVHGVRWTWTARDRRGRVLGHDSGSASINPREAHALQKLAIKLLPETALGPVVVELRAEDSQGRLLSERTHIFGTHNSSAWPLDGLLRNAAPDRDDTTLAPPRTTRILWIQDLPGGAYDDTTWYLRRFGVSVTHVAAAAAAADFDKLAPTTVALLENYDAIWIGTGDFNKTTPMGQRLGAKNLANIASAVKSGLGIGFEGGWTSFAAASFAGTALEEILPVESTTVERVARHAGAAIRVADSESALGAGRFPANFPQVGGYLVLKAKAQARVVLNSSAGDPLLLTSQYGKGRVLAFASSMTTNWLRFDGDGIDWAWNLRAWSGHPFFLARMLAWLGNAPDSTVRAIDFPDNATRTTLPVRRTTLQLAGTPTVSDSGERMTLQLRNTGPMTALFCSPHSILEYRTNTTVSNGFVSIPPGETRPMTITAGVGSNGGLNLAQEGWRISCWNTADLEIPPGQDVLLSFGRRDSMTREFGGPDAKIEATVYVGVRPSAQTIPWILTGPAAAQLANTTRHSLQFEFDVDAQQAVRPSRLRIHTADQAPEGTVVEIEANGHVFTLPLQQGLGKQADDPAHLAFPETATFQLPEGTLRAGGNSLTIAVKQGGWFTWDSLDLSLERRNLRR